MPELAEKVRELVRLAQEQGYLTYTDIKDALADALTSPAPLDEIHAQLRNLEIDIVEQAEVDRIKTTPTPRRRTMTSTASTSWTIPSACILSRWARCRC